MNVRGLACHENGIKGYGNPDAKIMIIGISPGRQETITGIPMSGPSGKLADSILEACGWHRDKTFVTNVVCYEERAPTFEQIMECRPRLVEEVRTYKPELCILLGKVVSDLFFPTRKFGTVRGNIDYYKPWGCHILPTYHPAAILHAPSEFITRDLVRDFQKIPEFFSAPPNPDVTWTLVATIEEAQHILDTLDRSKLWSLDVETPMKEEDDTSSITDPIVCFSISDGTVTYWFPGPFASRLSWPTDVRWGGQNFNFDSISLHKHTGVLLPITWDTLYLSYCLDERGGQHKLKPLAREYEAAGFYEEYPAKPTAKWNEKLADLDWLQQYNAKDSAYAARLAHRMLPKVKADNMQESYEFLLEAANVYRQMQMHGVYLNKDRFAELAKEWIPQLETKNKALQELAHSLGGPEDLNLGSPKQLGEFLFGTLRLPAATKSAKTGAPSTAAAVIEELEDEHDFIFNLLDLRHLEKAVNTYLVGVWDHLKTTGRLHPSPLLHGTVSTRLAYNNPAINTTPKTYNENPYLQQLRSLYTATDDDHVLIEMDYKQAEVWMAWQYSQDPTMLADLQSGDFHRQSAAWIWKILAELVSSEQRSDAKRITFGQFFLIGALKLARQANIEKRRDALRRGMPFDNPMTPADAATSIKEWHLRYPNYKKYVTAKFKEAQETGEILSLDGHKRRFPIIMDDSILTQIANWPIQTTAHMCLMKSIVQMFNPLVAMGAYPLIDVHDAVLIEAHKRNALDVAKRARDIMIAPKFPGVVSLPVEVKMGYSWGSMEEIELAA